MTLDDQLEDKMETTDKTINAATTAAILEERSPSFIPCQITTVRTNESRLSENSYNFSSPPQSAKYSSSVPPLTSTPLSSNSGQQSTSFSSPTHSQSSSTSVPINTPQTSFNLPMSPISSSRDEEANNAVVTIIQVQSQVPTSSPSHVEKDADKESTELAITRINISGEEEKAIVTEQSQVVKVTVFNDNNGISPSEQPPTSPVVVTHSISNDDDTTDAEVRRPLRLGQNQDGTSLYQEDVHNDTASEISSVVNNPSVISQAPDRYGFMGGEQYTHESEPDPAPEIIRRREMKWLTMMDKWDHFMKKDFKTVRSRCRKGIPRSVRGRAWYYLCGAAFIKKKQPDLFFRLLEQEGKPECIEDIKKDLHRQFPWHEIFAEEGHGQKDLFKVLKAHSILNEKDGYCQAQAPIAAILLMHMPVEDAFWCLVAICDKYLKGYYSPGMEQLQLDGDILFGLLKRVSPSVYKHMKKQKIDPVLYMTEWFLCAFTRTLPWASVLRLWDSFLCEGVKVLFRVGLVLLKYTLGRTGMLKQCPNMYETLTMLKNLPNYVTHEQFLVVQVQRLDISDDQMRREHYKQVTKRKKAQQKLEAAKKQQQKANSRQTPVHKSHETAL